MMMTTTKMNKLLLVFLALLFCVMPVYAEEVPDEPDIDNVNEHGFWYDVFWGEPNDPGVFREMWDWFLGLINGFGDALLTEMIDALDLKTENYDSIMKYFKIAERWVPLSFFFKSLFAYWTFLGVFCSIKFVLKLIPMIG